METQPPETASPDAPNLLTVIKGGITTPEDVERVRALLDAGAKASDFQGEALWVLKPQYPDQPITGPEEAVWHLLSKSLAQAFREGGVSIAEGFAPDRGMLTFMSWYFNEWPELADVHQPVAVLETAILPLIVRCDNTHLAETFVLEMFKKATYYAVHERMSGWIREAVRARAYDAMLGFLMRHERDRTELRMTEDEIREFVKNSTFERFRFLVLKLHIRNIPNLEMWIIALLQEREFRKLRLVCERISDLMTTDGAPMCDYVNIWDIWDIILDMKAESMRSALEALALINEGIEPDDEVGFSDLWMHAVKRKHWRGLKTLTQVELYSPHICFTDDGTYGTTVYDVIMRDGPEKARDILRKAYPADAEAGGGGGGGAGTASGAQGEAGVGGGGGDTLPPCPITTREGAISPQPKRARTDP